MSHARTVFVVDDDEAVRDSLALLLETAGLAVETYDGAAAFLAAYTPGRTGCLILDLRMPGVGGPELQIELTRRGIHLPIIFLTAHGDIPTTVQAMQRGAMDFLTKPVVGAELLRRVHEALERSAQLQQEASAVQTVRERLDALTPREREIMLMAVAGRPNKEIARALGISHRTVEIHRARVMQKTGAASLVELSRMAAACGLASGNLGNLSEPD
jgi:FixJ family two-component response regulator